MDARVLRSRAKLAAAVLDLAESDGIESVSMVALAQAAGVHRSTAYEYGTTPVDLLRTVLREELDAIRVRHLAPGAHDDIRVAVRETTTDVLRHVDAHAPIYSRELGSGDSTALHGMLSSHFRQSVLDLLRSGSIDRPDAVGPGVAFRDEAAARFIADGTVGAIDAWLATPSPRDIDDFLAVFAALLPPWWPLR